MIDTPKQPSMLQVFRYGGLGYWRTVRPDGTIVIMSEATIQRLQRRIEARAGKGQGPSGGAA